MKIKSDASFYNTTDGNTYQRSSSLKTLEACNWQYYCSYVLKLPQESNDGARKGNVCHTFFECLINTRHKKNFNRIIKANSVKGDKACEKLVYKLIKRFDLTPNEDTFNAIDKMILVGLVNDFYSKGGKIIGIEYRFKFNNENPKYAIYGTMDKIVIKGDELIIEDYKSSKKKYEGEEVTANVQALMYLLVAKKLWPELKRKIRFIFLQYPKDPFVEIEYKDYVLEGFEEYLAVLQKRVDSFTLGDAKDGFAADKKHGENTFSGPLICGRATYRGQLKKDGTKMWHCPFKFPYDYYVLTKDGKELASSLNEADFEIQEGEKVEKRHYAGCPRFQQPLSDIEAPKLKPVIKDDKFWDDF